MEKLTLLTPEQINANHPRIVAIYRQVYTRPPYNKPEWEIVDFSESLLNHLGRDGHRFVAATAGDPAQLVGFAYGFTSRPGQWWYDVVQAGLPEATAALWLAESFQISEIAVDPSFQGQGIGGQLHHLLLHNQRHERAILSTLQTDTPAHQMYKNRGWIVLRDNFFFPEVERRYQIMGLKLK